MNYEWKKGILMISFGTRHMDTIEKTIGKIEKDVQDIFPEYTIYRAFTSAQVRKTLEQEQGYKVDSVVEALARMESDHITDVVIQPTMIIHGLETEQAVKEAKAYASHFHSFSIGAPLLHQVVDYKSVVHGIINAVPLQDGDALLVIGHGTEHQGNAAYPTLEYTFHAMGYENVLVGTIGEFPGVREVQQKLADLQPKCVKILPFFLVFGEHVKRELLGGSNSWMEQIQRAGYHVELIQMSFGEIKGISRIYGNHIEEAEQVR